MIDSAIDSSKSGIVSPFRSIRLRQRMEAKRNVTIDHPVERSTTDGLRISQKLTQEIDELIKKQKESMKQDFDIARMQSAGKTPTRGIAEQELSPPPSQHRLTAAVFASGDLDGADDEENIPWGQDDTFISENIEEAPVSIINPSSICTGLAKGATLGKLS